MVFGYDTRTGFRLAGPEATAHYMAPSPIHTIREAFQRHAAYLDGPDDAPKASKLLYPILGVVAGVAVAVGGLWAMKKVRKRR
jgi:hypothetical protein